MGGQERRGPAVEVDGAALELRRKPRLTALAARRDAGVDNVSDLLHRIEEAFRHRAPAGDEHERSRREGVGEIGQEGCHVLGREPPDSARYDHAAVAEERWRLRRLYDGGHLVVLAAQV